MEMSYPRSRTHSSGQCPRCRLSPGQMISGEPFTLGSSDFLPSTCNKCGYTEIYSLTVARNIPPSSDLGVEEILPE
jgi:predicted nucleic-acid-binding Zn-ribbon protein